LTDKFHIFLHQSYSSPVLFIPIDQTNILAGFTIMGLPTFSSILRALWRDKVPLSHIFYLGALLYRMTHIKYHHKKLMKKAYGIQVNNWLADAPRGEDSIVTRQDLK